MSRTPSRSRSSKLGVQVERDPFPRKTAPMMLGFYRSCFAGALILTHGLVSPATGQESPSVARVRAELEQRYDENAEAYMRGDLAAVMALRTSDFHAVGANGVRQDRAAMENYMQGIMNGIRKWNQLTFVIDSLTVEGDTATAVVWQFADRIALRPDNQAHLVQTWVTQRETWLYQGGRWLMWRVDQLRNQRRLVDGKPG